MEIRNSMNKIQTVEEVHPKYKVQKYTTNKKYSMNKIPKSVFSAAEQTENKKIA